MTIYIVENYYNEPNLHAYKNIDSAKLGLLEQYVKNCLPKIIKCIKDSSNISENIDCIQTDLENILTHSYVEDFGIIYECELEE
jgi:hypothetical protein